MARKRLTQRLRFPKDVVADVTRLVELHLRFHGYGDRGVDRLGGPPVRHRRRPAAVPAARADPGRLHDPQPGQGPAAGPRLRQPGGADRASSAEQEELAAIRPDLDGNEIMAILGVPPGPLVGRAYGTCWSCGWSTARWAGTGRFRSCWAGPPRSAWRAGRRAACSAGRLRAVRGLTADQPVARPPRPRSPTATTSSMAIERPVVGHEDRADGRAGHERDVEQHVVEGEDPAAVGVVDLLLQDRGRADGHALGGQAEQEADDQEAGLAEAGPEDPRSRRRPDQQAVIQLALATRRVTSGVMTARGAVAEGGGHHDQEVVAERRVAAQSRGRSNCGTAGPTSAAGSRTGTGGCRWPPGRGRAPGGARPVAGRRPPGRAARWPAPRRCPRRSRRGLLAARVPAASRGHPRGHQARRRGSTARRPAG